MHYESSTLRRWLTVSLVAIAVLIAPGCGVYDVPDEGGGGGGGGGGTPALSASFQLPADGATVDAATMLRVTGSGIIRVSFRVNQGATVYDTEEPYEVEFNPFSFYPGVNEIQVSADGYQSISDVRTIQVVVARPRPPLADMLAAINGLADSHWYEVPWSQMQDVEWVRPSTSSLVGNTAAIMGAASGGAFDTKRNRLIVWGGGGRNDLYTFDVDTLEWERITDPTDFPPGGEGNAFDLLAFPSDSSPVHRKSEAFLAYVPDPVDRFLVLGGIVLGSGGNSETLDDTSVYEFDFDTKTWAIRGGSAPVPGFGMLSATDGDGNIWLHGTGSNSQLARYDPFNETTTLGAEHDGNFPTHRSAAVDSANNQLIALGDDATVAWDLDNPGEKAVTWATTGDTEIEQVGSPGVVYHAASGRIVAWGGGSSVYVLDTTTKVWTKIVTAGAVDPGPQAPRGTYGRFQYVPDYDVFIVVSAVDDNVFLYRLPD